MSRNQSWGIKRWPGTSAAITSLHDLREVTLCVCSLMCTRRIVVCPQTHCAGLKVRLCFEKYKVSDKCEDLHDYQERSWLTP